MRRDRAIEELHQAVYTLLASGWSVENVRRLVEGECQRWRA